MSKLTAQIIVILFCWIIYPYKWIVKAKFIIDKQNAIRDAGIMANEKRKAVYVVQYGKKFHVGLRSEFRAKNSTIVSHLKKQMHGFLEWDYRNSIIYTANEKLID